MKPEIKLTPEAHPLGLDGILIRFALQPHPNAIAAAQAFNAALNDQIPDGVIEVSPAMVSVLIRFDRAKVKRDLLAHDLLTLAIELTAKKIWMPSPSRRWTIPVAFGDENGPQLAEVSALMDMGQEAVVAEICERDLNVIAIGFAPGQPYVGLLPDHWDFPRMSALNPKVPVGAVVTAVRQIVMYSAEGATGWRQIGRSAIRTFLPDRTPPMPLKAGDAIRYSIASAAEIESLAEVGDGLGGARLEILS
nr:carboxyltransferase domain-containing protein [uncultured Cohaesibacter sp.]